MARRDYDRRLRSLARQIGCPVHGTPLVCAVCDVEDGLTEDEWIELESFLAKLDLPRHPGPTYRLCPHCDAPQTCLQCCNDAPLAWSRLDAGERGRLRVLLGKLRLNSQRRSMKS
jgi:hypothetical protein